MLLTDEVPRAYLSKNDQMIRQRYLLSLDVDLDNGVIINVTKSKTYQAQPVSPFMQKLLEAGGLIPYVQKQMAGGGDA